MPLCVKRDAADVRGAVSAGPIELRFREIHRPVVRRIVAVPRRREARLRFVGIEVVLRPDICESRRRLEFGILVPSAQPAEKRALSQRRPMSSEGVLCALIKDNVTEDSDAADELDSPEPTVDDLDLPLCDERSNESGQHFCIHGCRWNTSPMPHRSW
jgi:hypothetical protein